MQTENIFQFKNNINKPLSKPTISLSKYLKSETSEKTEPINIKTILDTSYFINVKDDVKNDKIDFKLKILSGKLENGAVLTNEELAFLKKYSPYLYNLAMKAKLERETFERQLKNCKSKAEVDNLMQFKIMRSIAKIKIAKESENENEVFEQITIKNTIENEYQKFITSKDYKDLPKAMYDERFLS